MNNLRFVIAFITAKLYIGVLKIFKMHRDDKPGYLAYKICPNFLAKMKKPKTVIAVTGTNGKTTVQNLLAEILIKDGKRVVYNDWGANLPSSNIRCLLDGVTIFNKVKADIAVLETDEISSEIVFSSVKPNYVIITNLFRDSMHRNGNPDFVYNKINNFLYKNSILILNADDPFSSRIGENTNKSVYFGISKLKDDLDKPNTIVNDFATCPKCYTNLKYNFSRYHHIGSVYCPNCDFKSKNSDYLVTKIDYKNKKITILNKNKSNDYELINESVFNIYNELAVIACLKELGLKEEKIKEYLKNQQLVKFRYTNDIVNGIELNTMVCKGFNGVAMSRVFDYVSKLKGNISIILATDDIVDKKGGSEVIAWIYDADFEFLNKDNIKSIIIGGTRNRDYRLRLLLAGFSKEKIFSCESEYETYKLLNLQGIDKILILHDITVNGRKIKDQVKEWILKGGDNNEN